MDACLKSKTFQILTKLNIEHMNLAYRDLSEGKMPINQFFRILNITVPNVIKVQLRTYRKMLEGSTSECQLPAIAGTAF